MFANYYFNGLLMGIVFGVPAGAVGVLTIRNALNNGFRSGFLTGLGASAADLFYAVVTVFGVSIISDIMLRWQSQLGIFGGLVIITLGVLNFLKKKSHPGDGESGKQFAGQFTSSFLIAIMNPATILSFFVAFAAFEISGDMSPSNGVLLIAGIISGTVFWWSGLSGIVVLLKKRITDKIYRLLNRVLGSLLIFLGIAVLINALRA